MRNFLNRLAIALLLLILAGAAALAQTKIVSGVVRDSESGEAVIAAGLMVKGTSRGAVTDIDGKYSIEVSEGETLECLCIGYEGQIVVVGKSSVVDFKLNPDTTMLEETVVVGYGTLKKSQLVGSVENVSGEVLEDRVNANITRSLQGMVPGLNIIQTDGKPTHGGQIYVRGGATSYVAQTATDKTSHSIGQGGSALVLIDGVEGDLSTVNPDDVESITVLKDASSSVIYGARAAYGVILVTTKNPNKDKISVSYNGSISLNQRTVMWEDHLDCDGLNFVETMYEFWKGNNSTPAAEGPNPTAINTYQIPSNYLELYRDWAASGEGPKAEIINGSYVYFGYNTNYIDLLYKDFNTTQSHNISVSGNSGRVSYTLSGRYYTQDGIFKMGNEDFGSYNMRSKVTVRATDKLSIDNNTSFARINYLQPFFSKAEGNIGSQLRQIAMQGSPCIPAYNEDGTYTVGAAAGGLASLADGNSGQDEIKSTFTTTFGATYTPFKDIFNIRAEFSYKKIDRSMDRFGAPIVYSTAPGAIRDYVTVANSYLKRYSYDTDYITANVVGTFTPKLGKNHNLNLVAGWNLEDYNYSTQTILRKGMLYPSIRNLELMNGTEVELGQGGTSYGLVGFFGRANYTLLNRYIFELSARYDGSSKFPINRQWGFFPSASVGWRVSEESWMRAAKGWLNNLKLRANAGSLGNGTIAPFSFMTTMGIAPSDAIFDGGLVNIVGAPAVVPDDLTWETVTTYDVGLDMDIFNSRLSLAADYYVRNTTDLYISGPEIPAIFGASTPKGNYGALRTDGWELTLAWKDAFKLGNDDFSYSIKGSLWDSRTWVTKYYNESGNIYNYYEGKELGEIWGFRTDGYFLSNEEADAWIADEFHLFHPAGKRFAGDLKFLDINEDNVINTGSWTLEDHGDLERIGNVLPRYNFGVNLDFRWKGIGLSAFFQGVGKRDWYPSRATDFFWGGYGRGAYVSYVLKDQQGDNHVQLDKSTDNWTVANADKKPYWTRRAYGEAENQKSSLCFANDYYLQNAAYVRLKTLTLDYTIPAAITKKAGIEKLRVYLTGENLFTWSPMFKHTAMFDPEVIGNGDTDFHSGTSTTMGDGYTYPMLKTFTFGINLTF